MLRVEVKSEPETKVSFEGAQTEHGSTPGSSVLLIPEVKIGTKPRVMLDVNSRWRKQSIAVDVPLLTIKYGDLKVYPNGVWRGSYSLWGGGAIGFESDDEGALRFPVPCGVRTMTTVSGGPQGKLECGPYTCTYSVPVGRDAIDGDWTGERETDLTVDFAPPQQKGTCYSDVPPEFCSTSQVTFKGKLSTDLLVGRMVRSMIASGLPWAPVTAGTPSILVLDGNRRRINLLNGRPTKDATHVAVVEHTSEDVRTCPYFGGFKIRVKRTRSHVTLHEARTGKVLAEKTFRSMTPACPKTLTIKFTGYTRDVVSTMPDWDAIEKWIKVTAR